MPVKSLLLLSLVIQFLSPVWAIQDDGYIMTVTGKIPPDGMGRTLVHEHLITNFEGTKEANWKLAERDYAVRYLLPYLRGLWEAGYNTLVECTPSYIGKDVELLRELSEKSGMQILTNTGYYAAVDKKYLPEEVFTATAEELAGIWEKDWTQGIGSKFIRPGFIKLGVGNGILDSIERKIVAAGMLLSKRTGLTVYVHTGGDQSIRSQYELAKKNNFDLGKLVWVHAQNGTDSTRVFMAGKGVWVSLDGVNEKGLEQYVDMISHMKQAGLLHRLLISHDDGWSMDYQQGELQLDLFNNGNLRPYYTIENLLIPRLMERGFSEEEINLLLVQNPGQALAITSSAGN